MKSIALAASLIFSIYSPSIFAELSKATFAGGCFWCMEHAFDEIPGITGTEVGFIGGSVENPTYFQVSNGDTGHTEAVEVSFDSNKISYKELLNIFWKNIDPLDANGQFCDRGDQYRSGIFYHDQAQAEAAKESKLTLQNSGQFNDSIQAEISAAGTFTPAEKYHQKYYQKNPIRYKFYRYSCGRDKRLKELWGQATDH